MVWTPSHTSSLCDYETCSPNTLAFFAFLTQYLGFSYDEKFNSFNIDDNSDQFDFIVVGAGSSGCVVANRLSENENWKVLLLERGDEEPVIASAPALTFLLKGSSIDYDYKTQPEPQACGSQPNRSYTWARGKVMGGSSVLNSMFFSRGNKWDYDHWATLGNKGWDWSNVLHYFKKSENCKIPELLLRYPFYHNTGGYQTIEGAEVYDENAKVLMEGWSELGLQKIDVNSGYNLGTSRMQFTTFKGVRQSTNAAFIRPIRAKRPNLFIRPNSWVTKVIIDPETKQAIGVEYKDEKANAIKKVYARKEVILSAGTINSPKLLMLSGVGPVDNLKESKIQVIKELPVGKNLQNHVSITPVSIRLNNSVKPVGIETLKNDVTYWLNSHDGPIVSNSVMDNLVYFKSSFEKEPHVPDTMVTYEKFQYDEVTKSTQTMYPYYNGFMMSTAYLSPKSRGEIKLDPKDPLNNQPLIYPNYFSHPQDIKALAEGAVLSKQLLSTKAFKQSGFVASRPYGPLCDHLKYATLPYYECLAKNYTGDLHHFVGTCKMGPSTDPESVVDPRLKVRGIKGLRVIDASIIPVIVRGNVHGPAIMIGEKGSDMIKEDWST